MIAEQARALMGEAVWDAMTEQEQEAAVRVHEVDCYQHLRNIFLNEMSKAMASHVANELKPDLDAFTAWERMTTDFSQLLRGSYKELHQGGLVLQREGAGVPLLADYSPCI